MSIPVLIITGFLGAGKTSLLRHLLPLCSEAGLRPALIINEVGAVDVDGQLLADLHAEQARIVGGCVCCTLQSRLAETVNDLLTRDAGDIIIIECSGISNPLDVVSVLSMPALVSRVAISHILCLLDASRVEKMLSAGVELTRQQASAADIIVLNKTDRLDAPQHEAVRALVAYVNPRAEIFGAAFGNLGREALLALLKDTPQTWERCAGGHCQMPHHAHHAFPASFCTVALPLPNPIPQHSLHRLLHALPDSVIRAKGFAYLEEEGWHVLQKVYDCVDTYPHTGPPPDSGPLLICIGQHLDPHLLKQLLP